MDSFWKEVGSTTAVRTGVVATLIMLVVFLIVQSIGTVENFGTSANPPTNTLVVSGEGTATAIPDTASISFGVTATAADVATGQTKITAIINKALDSVKAAGVASADITTTSFSVTPHYTTSIPSCPPGVLCPETIISPNSTVTGYDVTENVTVKVHDTTKVATILSGLAAANVSNVDGPNFIVDNPQAVQSQARAQAIQKAQVDAKALASQLGVHLGKIVSFSDNNSSGSPQPMFKSASADSVVAPTVPTTIPVGNNTYTDDVSITYEIN